MAGYNPPTTNAWDLIRRRQEDEKLATREALRVGGTQPFQTTRKTRQSIERLDEQAAQLEGLINSIPVTLMDEGIATGWVPTTSWQSVAQAVITRPPGKDNVTVHAVATVMVRMTSTEVVLPLLRMRVIIDGDVGLEMEARANLNISDVTGSNVFTSGAAQNIHAHSGGGDVVATLQVYHGWAFAPEPGTTWEWSDGTAQVGMVAAFTP